MLLFLNGLFLLLNSFNVDHDIHLSTCLIEYNQVEKALQITLHIYIDDLEDALELEGHKDLYDDSIDADLLTKVVEEKVQALEPEPDWQRVAEVLTDLKGIPERI